MDKKLLLYVQVPESSEVHKYEDKIFIRNYKGNFDISDNRIGLTNLYLLKQQSYMENRVYPYIDIEEDLKSDLIERTKNTYALKTNNDDWKEMSNLDFLKKNQLYLKDNRTKEFGVTLAGVLLFGTDFAIHSILPTYGIVLSKKGIINIGGYDDEEILECNLIEAYYRCIDFIRKCLPNTFFLEGYHRVDLRETIFREVVSNMLIHMEYSKNLTSWIKVCGNMVKVINGNKPMFKHTINIENCEVIQKNPNISSVFRMLGLAEQIGSGTMKLYKYCKAYGGSEPFLLDEDNFVFVLPINIFEMKYRADNNIEIDEETFKIQESKEQRLKEKLGKAIVELKENFCGTQGEF